MDQDAKLKALQALGVVKPYSGMEGPAEPAPKDSAINLSVAQDPLFKKHLKDYEKDRLDFYDSTNRTKGVSLDKTKDPTIGRGASVKQPEVQDYLKNKGIDLKALKTGDVVLTPEQLEELYNIQMGMREKKFDKLASNKIGKNTVAFDNSDIEPHEKAALMSLFYNAENLIGPNLSQALRMNDDLRAAREIMLNSNKENSGGIQKRRNSEAKLFSGENYDKLLDSLTDKDLNLLRSRYKNIKGKNNRTDYQNKFPKLFKKMYPRK